MKSTNRLMIWSALVCALAALLTLSCASRVQADSVRGLIVSTRGNILQVRPQWRPKMARVAIGNNTKMFTDKDGSLADYKVGWRFGCGGDYDKVTGFTPKWIEAGPAPFGWLVGRFLAPVPYPTDPKHARLAGNIISVTPLVVADDGGHRYTFNPKGMEEFEVVLPATRDDILIGTSIYARGKRSADGVIQADIIFPDNGNEKTGTMFGTVKSIDSGSLQVQPMFTDDAIKIAVNNDVIVKRQISLDPDTIKIGDPITLWIRAVPNPIDASKIANVAVALMVGPGRYPDAPVDNKTVAFQSGKLTSFDPVKLQTNDGILLDIQIPPQMPVVRIDDAALTDLKPGDRVMLILSNKTNGFQASAITINGAPLIGYGG